MQPRSSAPATPTGPPASTGLTAVAKNGGRVELTWSPPGGAVVTGCTIYREGSVLKFVSPTLTVYVDITVQPEQTYRYEIESVGSTGRSPRVPAAEVTTPATPSVTLAQFKGRYHLVGKVTGRRNGSPRIGEAWDRVWGFFPLCTD